MLFRSPFAKEMAAARRLYYQHAELASKAENRARQSASSADCYDAMKAHAAAAAAAAFVGYITKADSHARSEREFLKKMEQFLAKERNGVAEYTRAWRHTVAAT